MIYAGYVEVIPQGKAQIGWVKLIISLNIGEAKFSVSEGEKYTE